MNEILELLPIPPERDLPARQLEARRDALVAATRMGAVRRPVGRRVLRAARGCISKTRLSLLGILALALALVVAGFSGQQRTVERSAAVVLAAAGTAQMMTGIVAPLRR